MEQTRFAQNLKRQQHAKAASNGGLFLSKLMHRCYHFAIMRRLIFLIAIALIGTAQAQQSISSSAPQVKLRLIETVSSANAKLGQPVLLQVVDPVQVDGKVIIPAGSHASASVTTVKRRGRNHREGQLVLTLKSVPRADGGEALLQSTTVQKGSAKGEPIFGPCTFPIPADPVGLFRKGNNVEIPSGTELVARIAVCKP